MKTRTFQFIIHYRDEQGITRSIEGIDTVVRINELMDRVCGKLMFVKESKYQPEYILKFKKVSNLC